MDLLVSTIVHKSFSREVSPCPGTQAFPMPRSWWHDHHYVAATWAPKHESCWELGSPHQMLKTGYRELLQTEMSLCTFSHLPLLSAYRIWQDTTLSNGLGKSPPCNICLILNFDCASALLCGHGAKPSLWFFHRWSRCNNTLVSAWAAGIQRRIYHFLVTLKRAWK